MNHVFNRGDGKTYGFEVLLRKDRGRLRGWLGYSYSHTEYRIDQINQDRWFMPRHDRTSTINAMGNYDLIEGKNKLILGTNFVYSTGQPLTEPGSAYLTSSGPFDSKRMSIMHRQRSIISGSLIIYEWISHYPIRFSTLVG